MQHHFPIPNSIQSRSPAQRIILIKFGGDMATKLVALLLLSLLVFSMLASEVSAGKSHNGSTRSRYGSGSVPQYKCGSECSRRCGNTRYHKPCTFFCNKCCRKCLCVPPGTYGNKQVCPCYNNWKTQQGGPKCP